MKLDAFHGTTSFFGNFNVPEDDGVHFGSLEQASHRLSVLAANLPIAQFEKLPRLEGGQPGVIVQVTIRMDRPLRVADQRTPEKWRRAIAEAKAEGYDGLIYRNDYEMPHAEGDSYVVFSEFQILDMRFPFNKPVDVRDIGNSRAARKDGDLVLASVSLPQEVIVELDGDRIKVRVVDAPEGWVVEYRDADTDDLIISSEPIAEEHAGELDVEALGTEYLRDEADRRQTYFSQSGR